MKNVFSHLIKGVVALVLLLSGCVDEYELPKDIGQSYQSEVVIEGRILSGEESVFYVTRTLPLSSSGMQEDIVTNAQVRIIGENGYSSELAENIEDAKYVVNAGVLSSETNYAVEVKVGNEVYRSGFQPLLDTSDISELTWKEAPGKVSVYVSTEEGGQEQKYFMWSYEEDWQFHAWKNMNDFSYGVPVYSEEKYPDFVLGKSNPYYWCFGSASSGTILIYSTEGLKDNKVVNHELLSYDATNIKVSSLYSILVKQWGLTQEAYDYYRLMKLYTEESDGLFTPMPSDVRGNVKCISDETKGVRGYVIASTVKEKRMFIDAEQYKVNTPGVLKGFYSTDQTSDTWMIMWAGWISIGYVAFAQDGTLGNSDIIYAPDCVNCMLQSGATNERPSFWPENR